jgi:hypothetical protein
MMKNFDLEYKELLQNLNAPKAYDRLDALKDLKKMLDTGLIEIEPPSIITNNHIHTKYSFSPYSPTKAIWMGYKSGLASIGIMDHDSLAGAREFIKAGKIIGIPTTIGFEIRTDWSDTAFCGKRINNPDQTTSAYITAHGIPHDRIDEAEEFLSDIRQARNNRNKKETQKINEITSPHGITIDFDDDVVPSSYSHDGGSITERHLLYALTLKIIEKIGRGQALIDFLQNKIDISLSKSQIDYLLDVDCDIYEYDVLNILKGNFVSKIYIKTNQIETVPVKTAVDFVKSLNGIASYCYLGDVAESPTGDKKAQKFEDDYIDELLKECVEIGFNALSFMPSRNTYAQLDRLMKLCDKFVFLQISGEDINQPRQNFICSQLGQSEYKHLIENTWALIGHELAATKNPKHAMFKDKRPNLNELLELIKKYRSKS